MVYGVRDSNASLTLEEISNIPQTSGPLQTFPLCQVLELPQGSSLAHVCLRHQGICSFLLTAPRKHNGITRAYQHGVLCVVKTVKVPLHLAVCRRMA